MGRQPDRRSVRWHDVQRKARLAYPLRVEKPAAAQAIPDAVRGRRTGVGQDVNTVTPWSTPAPVPQTLWAHFRSGQTRLIGGASATAARGDDAGQTFRKIYRTNLGPQCTTFHALDTVSGQRSMPDARSADRGSWLNVSGYPPTSSPCCEPTLGFELFVTRPPSRTSILHRVYSAPETDLAAPTTGIRFATRPFFCPGRLTHPSWTYAELLRLRPHGAASRRGSPPSPCKTLVLWQPDNGFQARHHVRARRAWSRKRLAGGTSTFFKCETMSQLRIKQFRPRHAASTPAHEEQSVKMLDAVSAPLRPRRHRQPAKRHQGPDASAADCLQLAVTDRRGDRDAGSCAERHAATSSTCDWRREQSATRLANNQPIEFMSAAFLTGHSGGLLMEENIPAHLRSVADDALGWFNRENGIVRPIVPIRTGRTKGTSVRGSGRRNDATRPGRLNGTA